MSVALLLNNPLPTPKSLPRPSIVEDENACLEPPRKLRRVDATNVTSTPVGFSSRTVLNSSNTPRTPTDMNSHTQSKGKDVDRTPVNNAKGQSSLHDYSAFKGRGRYAKGVNSYVIRYAIYISKPLINMVRPANTLNEKYEIDSTRNNGLGYQYDEVVRRKEDRKNMDAADCECCRDVGPLLS